MKTQTRHSLRQAGAALFAAIMFTCILGIGIYGLLELSSIRTQASHNRWDYNEAFFHAENVLNWAAQGLSDGALSNGRYSAGEGTIGLSYLGNSRASGESRFREAWLTIAPVTGVAPQNYLVTTSVKVGNRVRTLRARVLVNPPSKVFDYQYFLNNWGWWWGGTITGNGDSRANWDFDVRSSPTVNGSITAAGDLESNMQPIDLWGSSIPLRGLALTDPVQFLHSGSERLPMPNLKDFDSYRQLAQSKGGKLHRGSTLVVDAVHGDPAKPGLYLVGTTNEPIQIEGPVVVPGDVVIKGVVKGNGTLYVGGSLYVAGDVVYLNGPNFSSPPETMSTADRDTWVRQNTSDKKDLICFAVRESVFGGDVNSGEWKTACFDSAKYGLKNVGGEANLGADGIANTPDDAIPYLDTDNNGIPDSAWFDADGDGVVDPKYSYDGYVTMTTGRAAQIANYPSADGVNPDSYSTVADNQFNKIQGVYYCNHAIAMRSQKSGIVYSGALVCRDEAIIYTGSCQFIYDSRIHSRYNNDPNCFIDLGLPVAVKVAIRNFQEIAPIQGFCTN